MKTQIPKAIAKPFDTNPMTKLCVIINNNVLFIKRLNEYLKLAEIVVVFVLRFVEDE
jgi:hypothetical protein